ncbi:MAG: FTR1 family iron permease [Helicobacteraceae bacterium]|jgi:high-affinity iron transporter|nr:FTR1 family iron permease [Helicobacteraceae bacterium]
MRTIRKINAAVVLICGLALFSPNLAAQENALNLELKEKLQTELSAVYEAYASGDVESAKKSVEDARALVPTELAEGMERHFDDLLYIMSENEDAANVKTQGAAVIDMLFGVKDDSENKKYGSWSAIVADMEATLRSAHQAYLDNDTQKAKNLINDAYFGFYEKHGVERATLSNISGKRASVVEYQFSIIKNAMNDANDAEVKQKIDELIVWLNEDAEALDSREISGIGVLIASLLIMLREGVEAILVIAAIAAYLVRSGNGQYTKSVYVGAVLAILASVAMAYLIAKVISISGAAQEIVEGAAMLTAVVVLFFVSNWMISKSSEESWKGYIEGKVKAAIGKGSVFALSCAAFLAVFREGAEVILFYQGLFAEAQSYENMVWFGFAIGCAILVFVFAAIRFGSLRLPLKPFFIGTSIFMYLICVAFAGGGVKELQEADVVSVTSVDYVPTIDLLGVYPTIETLAPQIALLILAIGSFLYYMRKTRSA